MLKGNLDVRRYGNEIVGVMIGKTPRGPVMHVAREKVQTKPSAEQAAVALQAILSNPRASNVKVQQAEAALAKHMATKTPYSAQVIATYKRLVKGERVSIPPFSQASAVRGAYDAVLGECLGIAEYFPVQTLVGSSRTAHAKQVVRAMESNTPAERRRGKKAYAVLKAKARTGNSQAQDTIYAIQRVTKPPNRHYLLTEENLLGFDYQHLLGAIGEESKHNPYVMLGVQVYRAIKAPNTRHQALHKREQVRRLAIEGEYGASVADDAIRSLALADLEKRRRNAPPILVGAGVEVGFNFGGFMGKIGKIAGPLLKAVAPMAKFIPFVGPLIEPALGIVSDLTAKKPSARRKVQTIKRLARAGNPNAKRDLLALNVAQKLRDTASQAKAIRAGAQAQARKDMRAGKFPPIARVLAVNPRLVSPYQAGAYAGLRRSRRVIRGPR